MSVKTLLGFPKEVNGQQREACEKTYEADAGIHDEYLLCR
jgi:hypothetical protein